MHVCRVSETEDSAYTNDSLLYDWVRAHEELRKNYPDSRIYFDGHHATLVPEELFSENHLDLLTRPLFEKSRGNLLKWCASSVGPCIFELPEAAYYAARSRFPEANFLHMGVARLGFALNRASDHEKVFAFVQPDFVQIIYIESGKLQFCNSFAWSKLDEAAYFILNVYDKLRLARERIPLYFDGESANDTLQRILSVYISRIEEPGADLPETIRTERWLSWIRH